MWDKNGGCRLLINSESQDNAMVRKGLLLGSLISSCYIIFTANPSFGAIAQPQRKADISQSAPSSALRINSREDKVFDFGTVPYGNTVQNIFILRNESSQPFTLDRIITGCECTSATILDDFRGKEPVIEPGGIARIRLMLDTSKIPPQELAAGGTVHKQAHVYVAGQPIHAAAILELRGRVNTGIVIDPPVLNFGTVDGAKGTKQTVLLTVNPKIVDPDSITCRVEGEARLQVTPVKNRKSKPSENRVGMLERSFEISVLRRSAAGPLNGVVSIAGFPLESNSGAGALPPAASYQLPYAGQIAGKVTAAPSLAIFGVVRQQDSAGRPLPEAQTSYLRTRWVLLVASHLNKRNGPSYWQRAVVRSGSPYVQGTVQQFPVALTRTAVRREGPPVPVPPKLAAEFAEGTAAWLRVTLLPGTVPGTTISTTMRISFPDKSEILVPMQASVE